MEAVPAYKENGGNISNGTKDFIRAPDLHAESGQDELNE
jgi:hypothetical protein